MSKNYTIHRFKKITMRTKLTMIYRFFTSYFRTLPDFIIIGEAKCGSTSLFNYMLQHPNIVEGIAKAPHYFDLNYTSKFGLFYYRSFFPTIFSKLVGGSLKLSGEASTYYMFHPLAAKRIKKTLPNVKLIVTLRNPVHRTYSEYHQQVRLGNEPLSFEDAIEQEQTRLNSEEEKILEDESYYSFNHQTYSYQSRGIYIKQLKRWYELFPKEQLLIICSEDLFSKPEETLEQIFKFLNVPNHKLKNYKKFNPGNYEEIKPHTKQYLQNYFKNSNEELFELLGTRFNW